MPDLGDRLQLSVEWEDPCAAKGEELRATWCRLSIHVGQIPVTRVHDERAQTVREAIYCSAYPLAEWFAFNWWSLLNEPERSSGAGERHNLRFAREGFALPDLELFSEESYVRTVWKPYRPTAAPVRFLDEGFALLESKAFVAEIETFVGKVVARLESQGISNTALAGEWTAIRETPRSERQFCETAGALGLDPYDLADKKADEILSVAKNLPVEMKREFFLAADANALTEQARWVSKCLRQLEKGNLPVIRVGDEHQLDAVARLAASLGPQVATSKGRDSSKSYLLARSLCEYLCSGSEESALLTRISSDRQKRCRAFAAELLAPADGLRKLLSGPRIARDEVAEAAANFRVSEWLVEHQVLNHRIAQVEGTTPLLASP
ncbi:MAG: ImmA/IrrE family metallo-endopeptidase [Limisphaerales bacterium]